MIAVFESVAKLLCKDNVLQRPSTCRTIPWFERHLTAASSSHQSVSAFQSMGKKKSVEALAHACTLFTDIRYHWREQTSQVPGSPYPLLGDSSNKTLNKHATTIYTEKELPCMRCLKIRLRLACISSIQFLFRCLCPYGNKAVSSVQ